MNPSFLNSIRQNSVHSIAVGTHFLPHNIYQIVLPICLSSYHCLNIIASLFYSSVRSAITSRSLFDNGICKLLRFPPVAFLFKVASIAINYRINTFKQIIISNYICNMHIMPSNNLQIASLLLLQIMTSTHYYHSTWVYYM